LTSRGKNAVANFGRVRSTTVQDVTVGAMQGVEVSAIFSDRSSRLDLFLLPDTSATYVFMVARVVDPGATRGDLQQSLGVIDSLHETS
jgi:hypothetical protein